MSLQQLSLLAGIAASVAVIISLIYVGIQVKDNSRAVRSAAIADAIEAMQTFYLALGSNRQASELWFNEITSPEVKSLHDEFQFFMLCHSAFLAFHNAYKLAQEGALDIELRESLGMAIVSVKDLPGFARYWTQRKFFFDESFRQWVDTVAAKDILEEYDIYRKHGKVTNGG